MAQPISKINKWRLSSLEYEIFYGSEALYMVNSLHIHRSITKTYNTH